MKKIIVLSLLIVLFSYCSDDGNNQNYKKIVGRWQLVELLYIDTENPFEEHIVTNGYVISFNQNQRFTTTAPYSDYQGGQYFGGSYSVSNDSILKLTYRAPSLPNKVVLQRIQKYNDTELILSNDLSPDGSGCIEGCGELFNKVQ